MSSGIPCRLASVSCSRADERGFFIIHNYLVFLKNVLLDKIFESVIMVVT
jgi:hypothetical protein